MKCAPNGKPWILALLLSSCLFTAVGYAADVPSFRQDIMPILFRAGCNAGSCHGSARGKDGFMLSLFGYDPAGDYFRITEEMVGRRVNVAAPDQSLLLLKAIGKVPHTGGRRFDTNSSYYRTLLAWIKAGAPNDKGDVAEPVEIKLTPERLVFNGADKPVQTKVTARFSDGKTRDVTALALFQSNNPSIAAIDQDGKVSPLQSGDTNVFARYSRFTIGTEVIVLPENSTYQWSNPPANNYIDEIVYDRLQKLQLLPSNLASDEVFVRRLYLDLTGLPPTQEQYQKFMDDASPEKRKVLIDELLESPEFADLWAGLWAESVRIIGGEYAPVGTSVKAADIYYQWIRDQFGRNRPLNEFVADQIVATGSNVNNGPTNLYTMLPHKVKFDPKSFAADFSQLFTGVQIQCAECHNHPFDRWTMNDYYGFVSIFSGMKRKPGAEAREYYIYQDPTAPPAKHLLDDRPVPPTVLGGEAPVAGDGDPRVALAEWLTSPENELFSRNMANRIWAHYMGRGLVEPLDDMRISNPPTNGPLLDSLSKHLVDSGFDLRQLVRDICNSRVYQLEVTPNQTNAGDTRQFSRQRLRRLRADVLLDSIVRATDGDRPFAAFPAGTRAIQYYPRTTGDTTGPHVGDPFFETFGRSARSSICTCEAKPEPTLSQALHLIGNETVQAQIVKGRVIPRLLEEKKSPAEIIDVLYLRALSRKPSPEEMQQMMEVVVSAGESPDVYVDIFWSLLNSTEFAFNH
ncbi:DUF1549 domain-containing protein [Planctomicrobium sp. SH661]|uniref:DUF1549 domain-containing protein n=1 Tax=Planctomicrobium sp. SH661 TaxID=3448124 RepID=UPI003F5BA2CD